jgi:hypothetical protein
LNAKNAHPGVGTDRKKCAEKTVTLDSQMAKQKKREKNVPK